jgi:hypothetical protein
MLTLSIAPADVEFRSVSGPDEPGVVVWRHVDGELVAYGGKDEQGHWLKVAGVGAFDIEHDGIRAYPEPSAQAALVEDAFRRTVLPLALHVRGHEVLHASAVVGPRGVVAFCATSETGKSTVAWGLARRGYELWGDDAVAVEVTQDAVTSNPLEFRISLRPSSAAFFEAPADLGETGVVRSARPFGAIGVLERSSDRRPRVRQLQPADAFAIVLSHAYCFDLDDPVRKRQMMESYLQLVEQVKTYEIRLPEGLDQLDPALDEIEEQVFTE